MTSLEPLLSWWNTRESREQKLLLFAAAFAAAAVLYATVYPVFLRYADANDKLRTADEDYRWLERQVSVLSSIRSQAGGVLPVNLPAREIKEKVERDLEKKKIKGAAVVEDVDGVERIKVVVEGARGGDIMRWLEELINGGYAVSAFELKNTGGRLTGAVVIEV